MSSATPTFKVAERFAGGPGGGGLVLRINLRTGTDIREFSAFPGEEHGGVTHTQKQGQWEKRSSEVRTPTAAV